MNRHSMTWQKIFINHIPFNGLISKVYEKFIQLHYKSNPEKVGTKDLDRYFYHEDFQNEQQTYMCLLNIINNQEMQSKSQSDITSHLLRWLLFKNSKDNT